MKSVYQLTAFLGVLFLRLVLRFRGNALSDNQRQEIEQLIAEYTFKTTSQEN